MTPRALVAGLRAAVETPAWLTTRRLGALLDPPPTRRRGGGTPDPTAALRASRGALRALARLRPLGGPWRATCLYRAVAGCLVLRRHGVPARLRLGTRPEGKAGGVAAHAWVEDDTGRPLVETPRDHVPLMPSSERGWPRAS